MRLRQLYEAEGKVAAFALGRMNPATNGHELLVNKIKEQPGDAFLFLTDRAPKLPDNPLTSQEKLDWARKSFDGISIGLAKTVLTAADRLYKLGYTEVTFLEGEDKLFKLLQQYNGVEKEQHNYNFEKINYVQLQRDAKAKGPKGMSGTKLRGFATSNDIEGFKDSITQKAQPYAEEMFKKLQGILGVDAVGEALGEQKKETPDEYMKRTGKKPTKVKPGTGDAGKKAIAKFKKSLGKSDKIEKDLDAKDKAEKEKQDENLDEYKLFKGTDNNSIKEQDPNKLKVLDWIADRADGKEHFLSFYRKGAAWSGRLIFIKPDAANKFRQKVEANPDHLDRIKQALTSIETTSKLFSNLGIKHDIRRAD